MDRESASRPDGRSDAQLLAAAREDADAFHVLYERYALKLYAFFERRTHGRDASLDLTAETFARVWLARRSFRDLADGSAAPWLFAIARRVLIASVKKQRMESEARRRLGLLADRYEPGIEPQAGWLDDLSCEFRGLPRSQRQAIELRVIREMSYEQIAASLRCSQTAVRIRVSRGLSALRHAMEGETG